MPSVKQQSLSDANKPIQPVQEKKKIMSAVGTFIAKRLAVLFGGERFRFTLASENN